MTLHSDDAKGWIGSIVFHLLLGVLLYLWKVGAPVKETGFLEVTLGGEAEPVTFTGLQPTARATEALRVRAQPERDAIPDLPIRRHNVGEDLLPVPLARKMEIDDPQTVSRYALSERTLGEKGVVRELGDGRVADRLAAITGSGRDRAVAPTGAGTGGSGLGPAVSVVWGDGGTRKKISGTLPSYPPGVTVEAQIKIQAVVLPDGTVKSVKPTQKGNIRLEEAALREVRFWKFEPLRATAPQVDQSCLITFNFQLR